LFDREFVESQEVLGATIVGQFRDLDDPNRFVWLRGFPDMDARAAALGAFYGGPVWKAHREAANATMVDSDNVLLLRPARVSSGFALDGLERPASYEDARPHKALSAWISASFPPREDILAGICRFDAPVTEDFIEFFEHDVCKELEDDGASVIAYFVTEPSPNNFPALPMREGENVFVWFCRGYEGAGELSKDVVRRLPTSGYYLRLSPTPRSLLR
jgi:hypothetical protein